MSVIQFPGKKKKCPIVVIVDFDERGPYADIDEFVIREQTLERVLARVHDKIKELWS